VSAMASSLERAAGAMVLGGSSGPVVIVTSRVADYLTRHAGLGQFRVEHRGEDAEIDAALLAIAVVAGSWRSSVVGTREKNPPEPATRSSWVGTAEAAARLGVTGRAVCKAIAEGRLKATKSGRTWRIHRADLEHLRASRPH